MNPQKDESPLRRSPSEASPIESLQTKIDNPNADLSGSFARTGFHKEMHDAPPDWEHTHGDTPSIIDRMKLTKKHHTTAKWIFAGASIFFIVALGLATFYLTGSRNVLSADKIDITVTGPTKLAAGDALPLAIEIKNNNASTLEVADLSIEYPQGSRSAEDVSVPLLRTRMGLGDISPGERIATTSKAIIFGEEGSHQQVVVSLEYRVAGSNAIFVKERAFEVEIDDSPIRISVDAPASLNSGNDVTLELTIASNSAAPLENVILTADYPFGFEFLSSDPSTSFSETVWSLGDLPPEAEETIRITGKLEGQDDEERIFRFEIGLAESGSDLTNIGTSFSEAEHTVRISRPFVDLGFSVDGKQGEEFSIPTGDDITLEVTWRNNLSDKLGDVSIELAIDGEGINESSIKAGTGFYNSSKNTVTWDKRTIPELALLDPGDVGRAVVTFRTEPSDDLGEATVNPEINLELSLKGIPVGDSGIPEQIRSQAVGTLKLATDASLTTSALHDDGPLDNSGPLPPKAETKTTYTILWSIANSLNDLTSASVSATLPPYVSWEGVVAPADEDITYDNSTGRVVWSVGTVRAGAGYRTSPREVAFQIGLTPSVNQVGSSPVLITDATLKGTDGFTGLTIGDTTEERNTLLEDESSFDQDDARVVD